MKRFVSRMLSVAALFSLAVVSPGQTGLAQEKPPAKPAAAKKAPPQKAKKAPAAPQPQWLSINVVRVKADMVTEYQDFAKNETIPALKKGGVKEREAWTTGVFGESFEYIYVTPIDNFAQYDSPGAVMKALGEEGARAYAVKARRLILSSRTIAAQPRADLSIMPTNMTAPPKLAVINSIHVVPGKAPAFEALLKSTIIPALKKGGAKAYFVSQTVYGGDPNEYTTVTLIDSFAEMDKGLPIVRGLGGQAGFNRFLAKVSGLIASQERTVGRYVPDLSFGAPGN